MTRLAAGRFDLFINERALNSIQAQRTLRPFGLANYRLSALLNTSNYVRSRFAETSGLAKPSDPVCSSYKERIDFIPSKAQRTKKGVKLIATSEADVDLQSIPPFLEYGTSISIHAEYIQPPPSSEKLGFKPPIEEVS